MPLKRAAAKPADTATMSNTTRSTKTLTSDPKKRGSTRYWRGSIPIASRARTSPRTRLVASSAAMAVPERPATVRAVISGPSSRTIATTMSVPMKSVAPSWPSSRTAWEITRKERMPDSRTTSPMASVAVNRIWLRVTRRATARPAAGSVARERRAPKPKRASAPRRESRRAVEPPRRLSGSLTGASRGLLALQPFLRLRVPGEGIEGPLVHLDRLVMLAAIVVEQCARVVGEGLRRHLAVHPLVRRLPGQRGQVDVLHQSLSERADQVEQVIPRHLVRFDSHDLRGLDVDKPDVEPEVPGEIQEHARDRIFGADDFADFRRPLRVHPARGAEILLVQQMLNLLTLDQPHPGVGRQLGDQHPRNAPLQAVKILLVLPDRAAVVEHEHGDARAGVLAAGLGCRPAQEAGQPRQGQRDHHGRTRTHTGAPHVRESGACPLGRPTPRWAARGLGPRGAPLPRACPWSCRRARARDGTARGAALRPPPPTARPQCRSSAPTPDGPRARPACTSRRGSAAPRRGGTR